MTIVCGIDFSPRSLEAAALAAELARHGETTLVLAHVVDASTALRAFPTVDRDRAFREAYDRLETEAEALRTAGLSLETVALEGPVAQTLAAEAERRQASLTVVGAVGWTAESSWGLGSTAERLAAHASRPVLVVRDPAPVRAWLQSERRLSVWVGDDLTWGAEAALRWAADLGRRGTCDLTIANVYSPPGEAARVGRRPGQPGYDRVLDDHALAALRRHVTPLVDVESATLRVGANFGRPADALVHMAEEGGADLLVVGTRQRRDLSRRWHGSMSQTALHFSRGNVVCVPSPPPDVEVLGFVPSFRRVLVATDLSPVGNRAVPFACGLVAEGGELDVIHVDGGGDVDDVAELEASMRRLVPADAAADRRLAVRAEVVRGRRDVATAIRQAAERLDVDAVCIATHGRSGLSRALLGSVAAEVLASSRRPVLLVPPPAS